ncbi:MAG: hypothetical protein QXW48_01410 [Thermoplasmata archaeon]
MNYKNNKKNWDDDYESIINQIDDAIIRGDKASREGKLFLNRWKLETAYLRQSIKELEDKYNF